MTKIINRLPAILLAVIIAAALSFAAWASLQPVYADDGGAIPPNEPEIQITSDNDGYGVPGQEFHLEASLENFPAELEAQVRENLEWKLTDSAKDYAEFIPDPDDPTNKLKAVLRINALSETSFEPLYAYHAEATVMIEGTPKTFSSDECQFDLTESYTLPVYDRSFDGEIFFLLPNESTSVDMQVMTYTMEHPEGQPVPADYTWNFDPEEVKIEPAEAKSSDGAPVSFTVTRLTGDPAEFSLQTNWGEEEGTLQYHNFKEISYDLEDYYIDTGLAADEWKHVIPDGSEIDSLDISVKFWADDTILPDSVYDLKIEKVLGYDEETFDDIVSDDPEQNRFPLKLDPRDAEDLNGNFTGGTAIYRITATAKEDSGFTGSTYDYIQLYSDKTLNNYGAQAEFASGDKYLKFPDTFPFAQYEVPIGTKLTLEVLSADGKLLTEGTDYVAYYVNDETGDDVTEFPQAAGLYKVTIIGKGEYYGTAQPWLDYVKVGKKNPMTVKAKTVKAKAKKKTVVKTTKAFTVKKAQGKATYKKVSGNSKITVAKNGKVTVKKGLKKGKTYKVKVKVSAPGNANYLSIEKTVTLKVKITK